MKGFKMKKMACVLAFMFGVGVVCAESNVSEDVISQDAIVEDILENSILENNVEENNVEEKEADQIINNDLKALSNEDISGAINWIKNHKLLTVAVATTVVSICATAGTMYFMPAVRTKVVNALKAAGNCSVNTAKATGNKVVSAGRWVGVKTKLGATYYWNHKAWTIPTSVVTLIVACFAAYDCSKDVNESIIKEFVNKITGDNCKIA